MTGEQLLAPRPLLPVVRATALEALAMAATLPVHVAAAEPARRSAAGGTG